MTDPKYDKIDCMLYAAMENGLSSDDIDLYNSLDESQVVFTSGFEKRKKQLIKAEKHRPCIRTTRKILWRTVIVVMIIMSVAFITIMSISAFRKAVVDVVVDFFDGHICFTNSEKSLSGEKELISKKNIVFSEKDLTEHIVFETNMTREVVYYVSGRRVCSFMQSLLNNNDVYYDVENATISTADIGGFEGIMINTAGQISYLSWSDGEYFYLISCYCADYDIMELAHSIK